MQTQLFLGNEPREELFNPIKNGDFIKAFGGLWTSTYISGKSEWIEWCELENFWTTANLEGWLFKVNKNARILKIDSFHDLQNTYNHYGYKLGGIISLLDYEKIAKDYDGMWLTSNGQWETRHSHPINLYGWDCESTHWFRWVFDKVEYLGKIKING